MPEDNRSFTKFGRTPCRRTTVLSPNCSGRTPCRRTTVLSPNCYSGRTPCRRTTVLSPNCSGRTPCRRTTVLSPNSGERHAGGQPFFHQIRANAMPEDNRSFTKL
ncbi:uncharacterized protein [Atheta coriaria]|uniref:uncharacterized protein isoform X16 n=1 Tax=Dalotia coriaria TaxID=877792 RepID=UPI0031F44C88